MTRPFLPVFAKTIPLFMATVTLGASYQPPSPYTLLVEKGAYLQALEVQEAKVKAATSTEERERATQSLAGFYGFVGDYQTARLLMKKSYEGPGGTRKIPLRSPIKYPQGTVQTRDAVEEIVRASRGRQIVILNEVHHEARNRAFATELALALRKEGFTYFAAETFEPNIEATQKRGYPTRKTGYYTLDPVFGDLVRQAQRVGYKLVAYEIEDETRPPDPLDANNARENAQSHNLTERIFRRDPKARAFIYVGYSHAQESEEIESDGRIMAWMAARLKKETGIDPLTIDQSESFEPDNTGKVPSEALKEALNPIERFHITRPSVLRLGDGKYWLTGQSTGKMDMQVFQPFSQQKLGRPDWLAMNGYRKPFSIDAAWLPKSGRTLLQAFVEQENDEAIPVDQVLLNAGKPAPVLLLPKGKYRLVLQDAEGTSHFIGKITQR